MGTTKSLDARGCVSEGGWVKPVIHARFEFDAINFYLVINLFSQSGSAMRTNRIR
jgi:hypothetical protein